MNGACIAWVRFNADGNMIDSFNVARVELNTAHGFSYKVFLAHPRPNNYCVVATAVDKHIVAFNGFQVGVAPELPGAFFLCADGGASKCAMTVAVFY